MLAAPRMVSGARLRFSPVSNATEQRGNVSQTSPAKATYHIRRERREVWCWPPRVEHAGRAFAPLT